MKTQHRIELITRPKICKTPPLRFFIRNVIAKFDTACISQTIRYVTLI